MTAVAVSALIIISVITLMALTVIRSNNVPVTQAPGLLPRLRQYLGCNLVETEPNANLPELRTPRYEDTSARALYDCCCLACRRLGWEITRQSSETLTLEAIAPNRLIGFEDHVTVKCTDIGRHAVLNVRSASGFGIADFGANLRHVMDLNEQVNSQLRTVRNVA